MYLINNITRLGGKLEWLNRNIIATGTNELAQEIASRITEIHVDPDGTTA